jgi:GAF domain-containing protein
VPLGVIHIRRTEVRPFTDKQVKLLQTFADQAVIAIENVRLFKELQARNRDLTEALEQQTATSEVLRVIASSPTDLQPVLDTVIANAVKLSGATRGHIRRVDGELLRLVAHYNESAQNIATFEARPIQVNSEGFAGRVLRERQPVHIPDVEAEAADQYAMGRLSGTRTMLGVPLLREGTGVGTISIWRNFVEPFTDRQIELVRTFASQAVIAIENVRLFKELQERNRDLTEALEQQTATSEVLNVIARSPVELEPVYQAILAKTTRLCEANIAALFLYDGELLSAAASYGTTPEFAEFLRTSRLRPGRETSTRLAALERRTVQVPDMMSDPAFSPTPTHRTENMRTVLSVPMLREDKLIGVITSWRREVRSFSDKQGRWLKRLPTKPSLRLRTCGCSRNCRHGRGSWCSRSVS